MSRDRKSGAWVLTWALRRDQARGMLGRHVGPYRKSGLRDERNQGGLTHLRVSRRGPWKGSRRVGGPNEGVPSAGEGTLVASPRASESHSLEGAPTFHSLGLG